MSVAMRERQATRARRALPPRGFTLAEAILSVTLLGLVLGAMMTVLARQQRFYRGVTDIVDNRSELRQAATALPADLRAISPAAGDLYSINDKAIEFRAVIGSSIVCAKPTPTSLIIPPQTLVSGIKLTAWRTTPVAGDSVFVFDDGSNVSDADDGWRSYAIGTITPVTGVSGCALSSKFVSVSDTSQPSYLITLPVGAPAVAGTILTGAPIRFYRRVHYVLFQAVDSSWYLGYYDCITGRAPACNALQQLAGPFQPYSSSSPGSSGLLFTYYDSTGTALTASSSNATKVARIRISVRGQSREQIRVDGLTNGVYADSLVVDVGIRNQR
jgi:hypothetical protein